MNDGEIIDVEFDERKIVHTLHTSKPEMKRVGTMRNEINKTIRSQAENALCKSIPVDSG